MLIARTAIQKDQQLLTWPKRLQQGLSIWETLRNRC